MGRSRSLGVWKSGNVSTGIKAEKRNFGRNAGNGRNELYRFGRGRNGRARERNLKSENEGRRPSGGEMKEDEVIVGKRVF